MGNSFSYTHACRSDDYMDHLLGAPKVEMAGILERLMADNVYVKCDDVPGSWNHIPAKLTKGSKYFNSLERACNAICEDEAIVQYKQQENNGPFAEGIWFDCSEGSTYSLTESGPADLIYLLKNGEKKDYLDLIEKMRTVDKKKMEHDARKDATNDQRNDGKHDPADPEAVESSIDLDPEEICSIFISWLSSIIIFKIKPDETERKETIIQLATHMQQILREQHDRRFVFGMILFHNKLSMWYCDRSGLVGTYDPINIHEDPEKFIRVISSLALMTPWELGWDETMKIIPKHGAPMYTHDPTLPSNQLPEKPELLQWEIMIDKSLFRTIKAISTSRSEIMCGRAPLVWLAACVNDDIAAEEAKPVVIKQSWRPCWDDSKSEHDFYEHAYKQGVSENMVQVLLHYDQPGTKTLSDFRKGIEYVPEEMSQPRQIIQDNIKKNAKKKEWFVDEPSDVNVLANYFNREESEDRWPRSMALTPRCQYRLVLSTYGWPLMSFKNLRELLAVFQGAIEDYETLYYTGICHRDISNGNIIIDWETGIGRLIDLDHAKLDEAYLPLTVQDAMNTIRRNPYSDNANHFRDLVETLKNRNITADESFLVAVVHSYSGLDSDTRVYNSVMELVRLIRLRQTDFRPVGPGEGVASMLSNKQQDDEPQITSREGDLTNMLFSVKTSPRKVQITAENTGVSITEKTNLPPQFQEEDTFITGTKAFMSHELLSNSNTNIHKAVHDMESFFWNAVYLCMTRSGPGGKRRQEFTTSLGIDERELEDISEEEVDKRQKVFQCTQILFENEPHEIYTTKLDTFEHPEKLEKSVFPLFHDYFKPLQPLILSWWNILTVAFPKARGSAPPEFFRDHIIAAFKNALNKAILEFMDTPRGYEAEETFVASAREQEIDHIKEEVIRLKDLYSKPVESNATAKSATLQERKTSEKRSIPHWTSDLSLPILPSPKNRGSPTLKKAKLDS